MPIKKSTFETKWYYRVGKVLALAAPLIAAMIALAIGKIDIVSIKDQIAMSGWRDVLAMNTMNIVYIVGAVAVYYILIAVIWKVFLYVAFGGMIDDTKGGGGKPGKAIKTKIISTVAPSSGNSDLIQYFEKQSQQRGEAVLWIILIILFIFIALYNGSSPSPSPTPKQQTCIPTGCGTGWRSSCTNGCYSTQSACRESGEKCGGNVTCRQCPTR